MEEAFAQALRSLRLTAQLSQEELADEAGLHRTYVSQLERGLKSPSLATMVALSAALGVAPSALIYSAERLSKSRRSTTHR